MREHSLRITHHAFIFFMSEIILHNQTYNYQVDGSGRPLLLLHGFTGCGENWQPLIPALAQHYQVIRVDLLGHGRSAHPADENRYTMQHQVADLIALLDALHIEQTSLLGYSMGGRVALATAVAHPQRISHLILESASPGLADPAEQQARIHSDRALADWIEAHGIPAFVERWEQLPLWGSQQQLSPEARAALRQQRLQNSPLGLANSLRGMGTGAQPSYWHHLPALTMPLLLIAGELDAKFVAINRQIASLLAHAQLEIVPGAGHTVHLERPLAYTELIVSRDA
jgi:2-succinyl-6-hydroxy-2,4-cyclohexadiene-1-carboxylate synthase